MSDKPKIPKGDEVSVEDAVEAWLEEFSNIRRPTINDVARLAKVSKKTVSRVINGAPQVREKTRNFIQDIIDRIGFEPDIQARSLAFRHAFLVGMIYDNPNPQYVVNVQEGVLEALRASDFELVIHHCNRAAPDFREQAVRFVERHRLYGVILTPSVSEDDKLAQALAQTNRPFIRIASIELDEPKRMIVSNDRLGGIAAAHHLASLGHKDIAFISGLTGFRSSEERQKGFEEGLKDKGLTLKLHFIFEGAYTLDSGIAAAERMLSLKPRPTAVFAANDEMAVGVMQAARARGVSVPDDLSVMGYDDFSIALATTPRLTTVHSPTKEVGKLAAMKLLNGGVSDENVVSETVPWLVVRESTARASGK